MKTQKIVAIAFFSLLFASLCVWLFTMGRGESDVYVKHGSTLVIKEGVTEISYGDIKGDNYKRIQFPSSLKRIGQSAFSGFQKLDSVTIPEGVVSIGCHAFSWCQNLTTVVLPSTLDTIGLYAFSGCPSLTSIEWPASLSSLSKSAFDGTGLNGVLCYDEGRRCAGWVGELPDTLIIPEGVASIDDKAFICSSIHTVVFPSTLKRIGEGAFQHCLELSSLENIHSVASIEMSAFYECPKLSRLLCYDEGRRCRWIGNLPSDSFPSTLIIPEGVVSIDSYAFYTFSGCPSIHEVIFPKSLRTIGESAFGNSNIEKLILPGWVDSIGSRAFLYAGEFHLSDSISFLDDWALPRIRLNRLVFYANGTKCYGWVGDPDSCPPIVRIPKGVTYLKSGAFSDCTNLEEVYLPEELTSIEPFTFSNCKKLRKVHLPSILKKVNLNAFRHCESLTDMEMPSGVCAIIRDFYGEVTELQLVSKGVSTKTRDFYYCQAPFDNGLLIYANGTKCGGWLGAGCPDSICLPQGVLEIDSFAFRGCESLRTIVLPEGVESIGAGAFSGCGALSKLQLPSSLKSIGKDAFRMCYSLRGMDLPDSLRTIGAGAFWECSHIPGFNLPKTLDSIGEEAFYNCDRVKSIVIPTGVKCIGVNTFAGCDSLRNVEIPEGVETIGAHAFENCCSLENVMIPNSVSSISAYAFSGCHALENVTIPNSVSSIGAYAFSGCHALKNITLPNSVLSIGNNAFEVCYRLSSIKLPDSVKVVKRGTFLSCSSLQKVELPSSLERIEAYAFVDGPRRSSMVIDKRVKVHRDAFEMSFQTRWENFQGRFGRLMSKHGVTFLCLWGGLLLLFILLKRYGWNKVLKILGVVFVVALVIAIIAFIVFLYSFFTSSAPFHG
ncbi:MAG: leucine-rich repeat domain-containing protein [Paludibacteraceae bacterium]|nr:leucine-rich repeat domain-containing protein [Paludibacteraceae bacterium]